MNMQHKPLDVLDNELCALMEMKAKLAGKMSPMDQDMAVSALNHLSGLVLRGGGAEALLVLVRKARGEPGPSNFARREPGVNG